MAVFTELVSGAATPREVYGGTAAAVDYLLASADSAAVAFLSLDTDGQKRALIGATRYIDGFFWLGTATALAGGTPTTLQFPRTGLTDAAGAALDATNVPLQVVNAAFEMAALVAADPSVTSNVDQGSLVSSLGAGPANLSFFRPTSVFDGNATILPTVVDRLIGRWLASSLRSMGGIITGTNPCSDFATCVACSTTPCSCSVGRRDLTWPL